jgi:hypothetical protein
LDNRRCLKNPIGIELDFGAIAQRSEQQTHNLLVPGSNPGGPIPQALEYQGLASFSGYEFDALRSKYYMVCCKPAGFARMAFPECIGDFRRVQVNIIGHFISNVGIA